MKLMNYEDVPAQDVSEPGADRVKIRWLIGDKDNAPNFAMRLFEVKPGGFTPLHSHPWEHEVFILNGQGKVVREGEDVPIKPGDFVFIPPEEKHQFKNDQDSLLSFLCLIPISKQVILASSTQR